MIRGRCGAGAARLAGLLVPFIALAASSPSPEVTVVGDLLAHWQQRQAGLGEAPVLRTFASEETIEISGSEPQRINWRRTSEGHYRMEKVQDDGLPLVFAFDGRIAWFAREGWGMGLGVQPIVQTLLWACDPMLGAGVWGPRTKVTRATQGQLHGAPCLVAELTDTGQGSEKIFIDPAAGRLLRLEHTGNLSEGNPSAIEWSDFRPAAGLLLPYGVRFEFGPKLLSVKRSVIRLNPPIDEGDFLLSTEAWQTARKVQALLRRNAAAVGHLKGTQVLRTRVTRLSIEDSLTGTKTIETVSQSAPNLILIEAETPGLGHSMQGFDGKTGWMVNEVEGSRPLQPTEVAALLAQGNIHNLGRLDQEYPLRRWLGERRVDRQPALAVALATLQGPVGVFYFDPDTARVLRVALPIASDRANLTESTIDFSDFRRIDGVEMPFRMEQKGPLVQAVRSVLRVTNNPPLDPKIFRPRSDP